MVVQEVIQKMERGILFYIKSKIEDGIKNGVIKLCDFELIVFVMLKFYIVFIFDWEKQYFLFDKEMIVELFELYVVKGLLVNQIIFFFCNKMIIFYDELVLEWRYQDEYNMKLVERYCNE